MVNQSAAKTGHHPVFVRTDGGLEYTESLWLEKLRDSGMAHQITAPYTPEQNGVAERFNRTVPEWTLALLSSSGLPKNFRA